MNRRRPPRVVVAVSAVLVTGTAVAAAAGFDAGWWGRAHTSDTAAPRPATATVTRQTLVDTQTEYGDLGYGDATAVSGKLPGTLTALPAVGSVITRGQAVFRVDDTPVVLLYGTLPAYRTLTSGVEGADVAQFEENLAALGYTGFTVDRKYTAATATAVKEWQKDLGLPKTGQVEPGRVHYATGAIRVDSHKAAVGDPAGGQLLEYTGTTRTVTVDLDVSDARLATVDAAVTVTLPDGKTLAGRIASATTIEDSGGGDQKPATKIHVLVTVADQQALAGLDEASLRVGFTASERKNVLTVPVAALLALAEGGYGVEVVEGTRSRTVAVETGLFADGRVEVTGAGLTEGTKVGVPS